MLTLQKVTAPPTKQGVLRLAQLWRAKSEDVWFLTIFSLLGPFPSSFLAALLSVLQSLRHALLSP